MNPLEIDEIFISASENSAGSLIAVCFWWPHFMMKPRASLETQNPLPSGPMPSRMCLVLNIYISLALTTDICSVHIFERKSSTRVLNSDQAALPVETYISRSRPQYTMAVLVFYISGSR